MINWFGNGAADIFVLKVVRNRAMIDLKDKVVMIAGANGGIGSHVAEVLIECGATTALSFHNNSARVEEVRVKAASAGKDCRVAQVDITSIDAVARWAESVATMFGKIDAAVNCCGSNGPFKLFADQDPSGWQAMLDIELMSSVYLAKAVLGQMVKRKQGRIISLGSDSGKVGNSGSSISAAARGGLNAFSKSLARELARYGVTVNTVCPGPTETANLAGLRSQGDTGEKIVNAMLRSIPLGRAGDPRDIGWLIAFLASDHASYITGQTLSISGGLTMC
jgi:2-hydroxycyclohexanecarboxyl-CoA dehydrogenase